MPLVINSLGGQTQTHTDLRNFKKPGTLVFCWHTLFIGPAMAEFSSSYMYVNLSHMEQLSSYLSCALRKVCCTYTYNYVIKYAQHSEFLFNFVTFLNLSANVLFHEQNIFGFNMYICITNHDQGLISTAKENKEGLKLRMAGFTIDIFPWDHLNDKYIGVKVSLSHIKLDLFCKYSLDGLCNFGAFKKVGFLD